MYKKIYLGNSTYASVDKNSTICLQLMHENGETEPLILDRKIWMKLSVWLQKLQESHEERETRIKITERDTGKSKFISLEQFQNSYGFSPQALKKMKLKKRIKTEYFLYEMQK